MSNQICRPESKGGSCELYGDAFSAPARPSTQNSRDQVEAPPPPYRIKSLIPIDVCTWHRLPYRWLPVVSHRTAPHARCSTLARMIDAGLHGAPLLTDWKCLSIYCSNRALQVRAGLYHQPPCSAQASLLSRLSSVRKDRIPRIATPLISRAVSSDPQDLSSHMDVNYCKTLSTRGPHSRARVFPHQDLSVDSARVRGCSLVVYLYLAVRVIGLRSVMRAHELQIRLIIPRLGGYLAMFVLVWCCLLVLILATTRNLHM